MKIKIDGHMVDVARADCAKRECFVLGFDKGSFSVGRGYTSHHKDKKGRAVEYPVCMTRHTHGCPIHSVCPMCRSASVDLPGAKCHWPSCMGITEERKSADP